MIHPEIFENINKVVDHLNNQGWSLSRTYIRNAQYTVTDYGNNNLVYNPQPLASPLFRGQNEFYEPCIATFYRNRTDEYTQFIHRLKIEEFGIVTSKHPAIKETIESGIFYDYVALAQHYEFKTGMLDLTNSLPVAAFFALTRQDSGKYLPMCESTKPGVLYFIQPAAQFSLLSNENQPEIHPVGWQVFKRPGEQRAFVVNLTMNRDFNNMSNVHAFRFWHEKSISEQIYHALHEGNDLFPKDIFAEKAARIKDSTIFSKAAFEKAFENSEISLTRETILSELGKRNISIQENPNWEYSDEDIKALQELSFSGKLIENPSASTRLIYTPPKKEE